MSNPKDLHEKDLSWANLSGSDLSGADLRHTKLVRVTAKDTDLTGADLTGADLTEANLAHACLHDARLDGAILADTDLRHADLSGSSVTDRSQLDRARLDGARGLDEIDVRTGDGADRDPGRTTMPMELIFTTSWGDCVSVRAGEQQWSALDRMLAPQLPQVPDEIRPNAMVDTVTPMVHGRVNDAHLVIR